MASSSMSEHNSNSLSSLPNEEVIFGSTERMSTIRRCIEKVATAQLPVLLNGESGTGKDVIARFIHERSPWYKGAFVKINCPAIPGTLMESELFGYERGGFTGANVTKPGRVELAEQGTLFLDEISELEPGLQSKLLQLLQDGKFCRIGASEDKQVDVRLICATNRQLDVEVEAGRFRADLFYRMNVVNISLPPLRQRAADVPVLVNYFLETYNQQYNCRAKALSNHMMDRLQTYHWPGNIRELENLVRRYVILGSEDAITLDRMNTISAVDFDVPLEGPISLKVLTKKAVLELEKKVILRILEQNHGNRKRTAKALNISYRALLYKIREVGVPARFSTTPLVQPAIQPEATD
jgi:two-component system response regulator AtoC